MSAKKEGLTHQFVPEHTKLSEKEAISLLKNLSISMRELPKILITDPAISHLDVKVGDIIKITRKSLTAGESIFYRGVIKA